ncbi:MAG: hypothetical protein HUU55_16505 [Myxococcales bacterium]|nr:hypothetical protein [Myxococcales bacterium]
MNILGLSVATTEHHAAALVQNGRLVAAAEEERFNRIKHYGAFPRGPLSNANLLNDASLTLRDVLCKQAIRWVLTVSQLTENEIDIIAINGVPAKYRSGSLQNADPQSFVPVRDGRYLFVPHHLCHAASAYRLSGFSEARVLTVDGRGERETAACFDATATGILTRRHEVAVRDRHSFGGLYETTSRMLGMGAFGQGTVMALAALGKPGFSLNDSVWARSFDDVNLDVVALQQLLMNVARTESEPLLEIHRDVAYAVQHALEEAILVLGTQTMTKGAGMPLCLAGGVALNCPTNTRLFRQLQPAGMFVQPAAHDAGTAIGAALEAAFQLGEPRPERMQHAAWGPTIDAEECAAALTRHGLALHLPNDPAGEVAQRLADGAIVCRAVGRMEIGPRALGQRSILADPRRAELKDRLNYMKSRASWRPFGPSILAGRESEWFEDAFVSPFMLFTQNVLPPRRSEIPVVVHADGSTRPQSVERHILPDYAAILDAFNDLTGVPMVVNTSFNRGGEPIVCTPEDAVVSFLGLGADCLQLGPFFVDRTRR